MIQAVIRHLSQGERTKFDRFLDPNVRIYESTVIEFFLRFKKHRICADVPRFGIENLNFIVSIWPNHEILETCILCWT